MPNPSKMITQKDLSRLGQCLLDVLNQRIRRSSRCVTLNDSALAVDQKLGEVPLDAVGDSASLLFLQEFVERVCILAVHLNLGVQIGLKLEVASQELLDVGVTLRLLKQEVILIDFKAFTWPPNSFDGKTAISRP